MIFERGWIVLTVFILFASSVCAVSLDDRCSSDSDCNPTKGLICDNPSRIIFGGSCKFGLFESCENSDDCAGDYVCSGKYCYAYYNCPKGTSLKPIESPIFTKNDKEITVSNLCYKDNGISCSSDYECDGVCSNGICADYCNSNSDCTVDYNCLNYVCVQNVKKADTGFMSKVGNFFSSIFTPNSDSKTDLSPGSIQKSDNSKSDDSMPTYPVEKTEDSKKVSIDKISNSGYFSSSCSSDSDCNDYGLYCVAKKCTTLNCNSDIDCTEPLKYCRTIFSSDRNSKDDQSFVKVSTTACYQTPCIRNDQCRLPTIMNGNLRICKLVDSGRTCVSIAGGVCNNDEVCDAGLVCKDKVCGSPKEEGLVADIGRIFTRVVNSVTGKCSLNSDCESGETCVNSECVDVCSLCSKDQVCVNAAAGKKCVAKTSGDTSLIHKGEITYTLNIKLYNDSKMTIESNKFNLGSTLYLGFSLTTEPKGDTSGFNAVVTFLNSSSSVVYSKSISNIDSLDSEVNLAILLNKISSPGFGWVEVNFVNVTLEKNGFVLTRVVSLTITASCSLDSDCSSSGTKNICSKTSGTCVECNSNSDCVSDQCSNDMCITTKNDCSYDLDIKLYNNNAKTKETNTFSTNDELLDVFTKISSPSGCDVSGFTLNNSLMYADGSYYESPRIISLMGFTETHSTYYPFKDNLNAMKLSKVYVNASKGDISVAKTVSITVNQGCSSDSYCSENQICSSNFCVANTETPSDSENNPSGSTGGSSGGSSGSSTSCSSLHGIPCSSDTKCYWDYSDGSSVAVEFANSASGLYCCAPSYSKGYSNGVAACHGSYTNPVSGEAKIIVEGSCSDDGTGIGIRTDYLCPAGKGISSNECTKLKSVSCKIIKDLDNKPLSVYPVLSLILTLVILIGYYLKRK